MPVHIDPRAIVSPKANLGENVSIGPFTVIEDDVVIGDGTSIDGHATVFNGARLGRDCRVHSYAAIACPPQDLKYRGEPTLLEVGDKTVIREFVTLSRGTVGSGKTQIGSGCLFMAYTHVGHDCIVGDNTIMANSTALGGHVKLGDWVILGGLVPVHQFVHVGDHAMVGGGFRAMKDVPPYVLAGRTPLTFEGLNIIGLRRRGFPQQTIEILEKAFRLLYRTNLNVSQAVARIRQEVELIPEVRNLLDFISESKRGIIPGPIH